METVDDHEHSTADVPAFVSMLHLLVSPDPTKVVPPLCYDHARLHVRTNAASTSTTTSTSTSEAVKQSATRPPINAHASASAFAAGAKTSTSTSTTEGNSPLSAADFVADLQRNLKRAKWLDDETTELGLRKFPWLGVEKAEVITALCSMLHGPLSKEDPQVRASLIAILYYSASDVGNDVHRLTEFTFKLWS
jgi:hypothetical protein